MSLRITSESEVTVEDLLREGESMWNECKKSQYFLQSSEEASQALLNHLHSTHRKFCQAYPIIARYMATVRKYSKIALRKYLVKVASKPWTNTSEYLDSAADYVVLLYKETTPHYKNCDAVSLRGNVRKFLQREHDEFISQVKLMEETVSEQEKTRAEARLNELRLAYSKPNAGTERGTVALVSEDLPPSAAAPNVSTAALYPNIRSVGSLLD